MWLLAMQSSFLHPWSTQRILGALWTSWLRKEGPPSLLKYFNWRPLPKLWLAIAPHRPSSISSNTVYPCLIKSKVWEKIYLLLNELLI